MAKKEEPKKVEKVEGPKMASKKKVVLAAGAAGGLIAAILITAIIIFMAGAPFDLTGGDAPSPAWYKRYVDVIGFSPTDAVEFDLKYKPTTPTGAFWVIAGMVTAKEYAEALPKAGTLMVLDFKDENTAVKAFLSMNYIATKKAESAKLGHAYVHTVEDKVGLVFQEGDKVYVYTMKEEEIGNKDIAEYLETIAKTPPTIIVEQFE